MIRFVYLARSEKTGLLKIGVSNNPDRRVAQLSNDENGSVVLLHAFNGDYDCEAVTHKMFSRHRITGEWFNDVSEIENWFSKHELLTRDFTQEKQSNDPERIIILMAMLGKSLPAIQKATGLTRATLSKLRTGHGTVSVSTQIQISNYLGFRAPRNEGGV